MDEVERLSDVLSDLRSAIEEAVLSRYQTVPDHEPSTIQTTPGVSTKAYKKLMALIPTLRWDERITLLQIVDSPRSPVEKLAALEGWLRESGY